MQDNKYTNNNNNTLESEHHLNAYSPKFPIKFKISASLSILGMLVSIFIYVHKVSAINNEAYCKKIDAINSKIDKDIHKVRTEILDNLKVLNNKIDDQNRIFNQDIKTILLKGK